MSKRLIQDLHAGISRRDWQAVEMAANRLRDDVEKTVAVLAGTGIGSLPNDYPLSELAKDAINRPFGSPVESDTRLQAAARESGWALSTLVDSIAWDKRQRVAAIIGELSLALHNPSPETRVAPIPTEAPPVESQAAEIRVKALEDAAKIADAAGIEWAADAELWLKDGHPNTAAVSKQHSRAAGNVAAAIRAALTSEPTA